MAKWVQMTKEDLEGLLALPGLSDRMRKKIGKELAPKSARYGKSKGSVAQLEAAQMVADILDIGWDNQDDQSPIHAREMGLAGKDLILRGEAFRCFPFDVEVKNVENLSVANAIEQANNNKSEGRWWLLYWKKKQFEEPVIIMGKSAFMTLYKELHNLRFPMDND